MFQIFIDITTSPSAEAPRGVIIREKGERGKIKRGRENEEYLERSGEIKICYMGAGSKTTYIRKRENVPYLAHKTKNFPRGYPPDTPADSFSYIKINILIRKQNINFMREQGDPKTKRGHGKNSGGSKKENERFSVLIKHRTQTG